LRRFILACLIAAAGCSSRGPGEQSDWERRHEEPLAPPEQVVPLPPYPRRAELLEFFVAATSEFRFFVDAASLSVGSDGIVRYVLVARSAAGAENVSFEGMRCETAEVRIYALGRDGAWVARAGEWRTIQPRSVQRWHNALYREYLCPQRQPIASAREGVDALRAGGHRLKQH
jgi:hypothetical protein